MKKTNTENELLPGTTRELKLITDAKKRIRVILESIPELNESICICYEMPDGSWGDRIQSTLFMVMGGEDLIEYDAGWDKAALLHCDGWGIGNIRIGCGGYGVLVTLVLERIWDGLMPEVIDTLSELRKI